MSVKMENHRHLLFLHSFLATIERLIFMWDPSAFGRSLLYLSCSKHGGFALSPLFLSPLSLLFQTHRKGLRKLLLTLCKGLKNTYKWQKSFGGG